MLRTRWLASIVLGATLALPGPPGWLTEADCTALLSLSLAGGSIDSARVRTAGGTHSEYCAVRGRIEGAIRFEVLLPMATWNGKLYHAGGAAYVGLLPDGRHAVERGYATVSTDTGHTADWLDASWALDRPDLQADFGDRAVHLATEMAEQIVAASYHRPPRHRYFEGCSTGGRQGLIEAQRYPNDFDGIIAGAPALDWTGLTLDFISNEQAVAAAPLAPEKLALLAHAVLAQCDARDGLADGLVDVPRRCGFDPSVLQCPDGAETTQCLSPAEVDTVRALQGGPRDAAGHSLYPGFPPGSEGTRWGWQAWITGPTLGGIPTEYRIAEEFLRFFVFSDPGYDLLHFDMSRDAAAVAKASEGLDATDPDLSAFAAAGGKLILWHGWADAGIPAGRTVRYYHSLIRASGGKPPVPGFARLFLAPGMNHCGGGPGPNQFDALAALERWVEAGVAPDAIRAEHVGAGAARSRPLCAYPETAEYDGVGDPDDAASFHCRSRTLDYAGVSPPE